MNTEDLAKMVFSPVVVLDYTNHRGVMTRRTVIPIRLRHGVSAFHEGVQDFLCAFDVAKNDVRDFAVKDIHSWEEEVREHLFMGASPRSPFWPKTRREHLKLQPICQACGGEKSLEVHHIKPYHLFPDLELDQANLITLCEMASHNCHFMFGHCLNWKMYNPRVVEAAAAYFKMYNERLDA